MTAPTSIPFLKGHGLGNDFVILANEQLPRPLTPTDARRICARGHGLGADGVLVHRTAASGSPFMDIFNADGSKPEMCGNGLRLFAYYLVSCLGEDGASLQIETPAGLRTASVEPSMNAGTAEVCVDMGVANFPDGHGDGGSARGSYEIQLEISLPAGAISGAVHTPAVYSIVGTRVSVGNPHLVIFTADDHRSTQTPLDPPVIPTPRDRATVLGPAIETHERFPEGTNVEWVDLLGPRSLDVLVWERGSGLTQACGTGACAATAAAARSGLVPFDVDIQVRLPGGELSVRVSSADGRVRLTGQVCELARGRFPVGLLAD